MINLKIKIKNKIQKKIIAVLRVKSQKKENF